MKNGLQDFIQALLLLSVFHEGLRFVGHSSMCINLGFIWDTVSPPCGVQEQFP